MMDQLTGVIAQLERQKAAIDNALAALRVVEGNAEPSPARAARRMTEAAGETTKRSLGQKKRWAAKKAIQAAPVVTRKPGMTSEGRKKLADAMKKRWAVKRGESQTAATKKRAGRPKKVIQR